MKIKKLLIVATSLTLLINSAQAAPAPGFSYDLFGTWGTKDREDFDDGKAGVGVGVNYFFTEHFGIGADTYVEEIDLPNHLDLSVIGRLPLDSVPVTPYAFVGVGRQWTEVSQWSTHIGIGIEYLWNGKTGIFFDVREVFADKTKDFAVFRLGLRCTY